MNIILPRRKDGQTPPTISLDSKQSLVVIGANGAGKTRFTRTLVDSLGNDSYRLSALTALYGRSPQGDADSQKAIKKRLSPMVVSNAEGKGAPTVLELLLGQLMHDEMVNLIGYKLALADGAKAKLRRTRLDKVIELWQEVFPGNRVLIDSGKILFSRGLDVSSYSSMTLSDGERAVLYYAAAILYAPKNAVIFVDSPEIFLHPTLTSSLWNRLESSRSDCIFCYTTHDPEFASSRNGAQIIWVRDCEPSQEAWDYDILPRTSGIPEELYLSLIGARKPVLFIEGDNRSIDARLYPLIFPDYTVSSLGSCNKVIEATRTFNDLTGFHKMDSSGIVDRDRRNEEEVSYLRRKSIMVPDVAEIENIFILEDVVRAMAKNAGKDPDRVFGKVKKAVVHLFRSEVHSQALQHTRHRIKRTMEYRVDARFENINMLEEHLTKLVVELDPRRTYEEFCRLFNKYVGDSDYESILQVYNQKSMLSNCNVAPMCGFKNKDSYINGVINLLRGQGPLTDQVRKAVKRCLHVEEKYQTNEKE